MNSRIELVGCERRIGRLHEVETQRRVEVGQEIDRVQRPVGIAAVFEGVDDGRVEVAWGRARAALSYPTLGKVSAGRISPGTLPGAKRTSTPPLGVHPITDQHEVHIRTWRAGVMEVNHCQRGAVGAQVVAENADRLARVGGELPEDRLIQDRLPLDHRRSGLTALATGERIFLLGRGQAGNVTARQSHLHRPVTETSWGGRPIPLPLTRLAQRLVQGNHLKRR